MLSMKGQVTASPSMKLVMPAAEVALLGLKAPPELDGGARVGPHQEDWACKDGGINQCDDKVGRGNEPSGGGC
jgi:hypothetical protein